MLHCGSELDLFQIIRYHNRFHLLKQLKRSNSGMSNYFRFHYLDNPNTYIYEMVVKGKVRWTHYFTGHCINTLIQMVNVVYSFEIIVYLLNYRLDTPLRHLYCMHLHAQCTRIELSCGRFIFWISLVEISFIFCVEKIYWQPFHRNMR